MNKRAKLTGRGRVVSFVQLPHKLLNCDNYLSLSPKAVKLLLDLYVQYRGSNNGDFSIPWSRMKERGWRSKDTLYKARDELIENGFVVQTRQGGKHRCSLYAITWRPIDDCNGKLECPPTRTALGYWKKGFVPKLESVPRIQTTLAR